jgi:peptide deformylase
MAILEILTYPDPFLRQVAQPVAVVDDALRRIAADMAETMYAAPGTGLAATQVGIDRRIIVYDLTPGDEKSERRDLRVLINPRVVAASGSTVSENEGCLSVPDFRADVPRSAEVRVEGLDLQGQPVVIEDHGFHAIVLQHEIDHLEGVLFIDRISALKREIYKRRIKKSLRRTGS